MDQRSWQRASICLLCGCKILCFLNHYFITTVKRHTFTMPVWSSSFGVFLLTLLHFLCFTFISGCWKLWSNPEPCVEPWASSHRRSCSYHHWRPRYRFVTIVHYFPIHKGSYGKEKNTAVSWEPYYTWHLKLKKINKKRKKAATFLCPFWEVI